MSDQQACEMKGMLSFLIMWMLSKREMSGSELASEIQRRRGVKPNPGTIYPALKYMNVRNIIIFKQVGKRKVYALTPSGRRELQLEINTFCRIFYDVFSR